MKILTLCDYYLPGYRAGGPIRTLQAMVRRLSSEFTFKIITNCHDWGVHRPYPGVTTNRWHSIDGASVRYLDSGICGDAQLLRALRSESYDVLYLNSLFSRRFSILPLMWRRCRALPSRPLILAPRGECSPGALQLKSRRKQAFLQFATRLGLHENIRWQASTNLECAEISAALGKTEDFPRSSVIVAPDLSLLTKNEAVNEAAPGKRSGSAKIVFLSRISPKKNLEGALTMLAGVTGQVQFDIVGPIEDVPYWSRCERLISQLPANIQVNFVGPITAEEVLPALRGYHLMLLPTLGENFGHAILESLTAGCPVLISDQTPWQNLEPSGAGWSFPLHRQDLFRQTIQTVIQADSESQGVFSRRAMQYAERHLSNEAHLVANRELFLRVVKAPRFSRAAA